MFGPSFWWDPWWYYPPPYYYPPPQVVVQPAPVIVEEQPPQSYWYYCPSAKAYYPAAPTCPEVWIKVPPRHASSTGGARERMDQFRDGKKWASGQKIAT